MLDTSLGKYKAQFKKEFYGLHFRLLLTRLILWPLPNYFTGTRVRAFVLRAIGFRIGEDVSFWGMPTIIGSRDLIRKLSIGRGVWINIECFLDLTAPVAIGDRSVLGMQTMIITGAHEIGPPARRTGRLTPKPVTIGSGVWIGARCMILPGVTIGDGAVIASGAVVMKDVLPNMLAVGVPAVIKRAL